MKQNMVCFKKEGKVIYFANNNRDQHFVINSRWKDYLANRANTPHNCNLYNTEFDARMGAIDYADTIRRYHLELNAGALPPKQDYRQLRLF